MGYRAIRCSDFNPRSPRGGATFPPSCRPLAARRISIHAPHEGERRSRRVADTLQVDFNPRSPRGGATFYKAVDDFVANISIHAPHEGERRLSLHPSALAFGISIHAPHEGERPGAEAVLLTSAEISIHAPHEGERQRKSAFVCSISANLLNIIHCGTVTRAVSRRRIALFRLFSVRRSGVFMYAYASH